VQNYYNNNNNNNNINFALSFAFSSHLLSSWCVWSTYHCNNLCYCKIKEPAFYFQQGKGGFCSSKNSRRLWSPTRLSFHVFGGFFPRR